MQRVRDAVDEQRLHAAVGQQDLDAPECARRGVALERGGQVLPDPVADAIKALSQRVTELETLLAETTGKRPEPSAEVRPLRNVRGSDPASG